MNSYHWHRLENLQGLVPPEYRQPMSKGLIGRAARLRKAQYSPDTRLDSDYFELGGQKFLSEAVIPLHYQGSIKGMLVVDSEQPNAFSLLDIETSRIDWGFTIVILE